VREKSRKSLIAFERRIKCLRESPIFQRERVGGERERGGEEIGKKKKVQTKRATSKGTKTPNSGGAR
jgi:hypothetical protein